MTSQPVRNNVGSCVDLDKILWQWAEQELGGGFTVEEIDASEVRTFQMDVVYQSNKEWFTSKVVKEELFDNNDALPVTWSFSDHVTFQSKSKWTLLRGIKSSIVTLTKLTVEFPAAEDGKRPLHVTFKDCDNEEKVKEKMAQRNSEWDLKAPVIINPYTSTRARVHLRTCKLNDVYFTSDIHLYGPIKVKGHKKRKMHIKQELKTSIDAALGNNPNFSVIYVQGISSPVVCFTVKGACSGEVGHSAYFKYSEVQSLV